MIHRSFQKGDAASEAVYSPCMTYRYALRRVWDDAGARVLFVMLNPSTATEAQNDPTVERCERRARALGFGGFAVANIFAFRATDPNVMRAAPDPIGPENDRMILTAMGDVAQVICAWGTHGAYLGRGAAVAQMLATADGGAGRLFHLGLTKDGHPRHPLYIGYAHGPQPWQGQD